MSATEIAPHESRVLGTPTDVPLARLHHELQCAAREAVGDLVSRSSSEAITALLVALDELLRFEAGLAANGDEAITAAIAARHEELRAACRAPVSAPRPTWDLSGWAHEMRHLLLAHIDATSTFHGRSIAR